jgi:WD40 repeat protein
VVKLHASIEATSRLPTDQNRGYQSNNQYAAVSSVAIWETQGSIKIFTGSYDGFWRLWNTASMVKEFEHQVGKVEAIKVASNFLFCGFENATVALPETNVGMIHAWNLGTPTNPPLELQIQSPLLPYAHNACTSCIIVEGDKIVSGSKDGSIRLWTFDAASNGFLLNQTVAGHAGQVTGLQLIDTLLWSSSVDHSIRVWDLSKNGACQFLINKEHMGHSDAVTGLLKFASPAGQFVLSSSLDGTIKAWNGTSGECVASETHGDGVVSMALAADQHSNPILLIGLESGNIMCRNVVQTAKTPAFCLLFTLSSKYTAGHEGAVKCLTEGPSSTFYSGGGDGKLMVWQIAGDLGI